MILYRASPLFPSCCLCLALSTHCRCRRSACLPACPPAGRPACLATAFPRALSPQVNLHKSGLKVSTKVVPETFSRSPVADDFVSKAEVAVASAESVVAEVAEEVKEEASEAVSAVKEEAAELAGAATSVATGEEDGAAKKKKKGWRKYWLFGPRVGGD